MPELPEVELVTRALANEVAGKRILRAEVLRPRLLKDTTPVKFKRALRNVRVDSVERRGKHILLHLDNGYVLIVHLRMSGKFSWQESDAELPKFTHALFVFDDDKLLVFSDRRHFGMMKIVRAQELDNAKELVKLAPEPFSPAFDDDYLMAALSRSRRTLKEILVDQRSVSGLGNIYAAEALFTAKANPFKRGSQFGKRRIPALRRAILDVLSKSMRKGERAVVTLGNLESLYYWGGNGGKWQVYDREGEPCRVCERPIRRVVHGGRSTYYCSKCQRR